MFPRNIKKSVSRGVRNSARAKIISVITILAVLAAPAGVSANTAAPAAAAAGVISGNVKILPLSFVTTPVSAGDVVNTYDIDINGVVTQGWQIRKGQVSVLSLVRTAEGDFARVEYSDGGKEQQTYISVSDISESDIPGESGGSETAENTSESATSETQAEPDTVFENTATTAPEITATEIPSTTETPTTAEPARSEPDFYGAAYNGSNLFAKIGLYGQCTWYAWGRAKEVTGVSLPFKGNAKTWYGTAKALGYKVSSKPRANSVVVWGIGSYGHVGFVESVSGNTVKFSHANYGHATYGNLYTIAGGIKQYRGVVTTTAAGMSKYGTVLGYIYI